MKKLTKKNQRNAGIIAVAFITLIIILAGIEISPLLKPAVVFEYNKRGYIDGHAVTINWAKDNGAKVTFDEFGDITFNETGYGENDKIAVQLKEEYGKYFCSTASCSGYSNWVSQEAEIIDKSTSKVITNPTVITSTTTPTPSTTTATTAASTILVWSDQSGVDVYVNTNKKGTITTNDWLSINTDPGSYQVAVSKSGYQTYTEYVTVTSGEQVKVEARMESKKATTPTQTTSPTATSDVDITYGGGGTTYRGVDIRFDNGAYYVGDIPHDSLTEAKKTIDEMIAGKEEKKSIFADIEPLWVVVAIAIIGGGYLLLSKKPSKSKKKGK